MDQKEKNYYGIGEVLRRLRKNKKLTQEELAKRMEVSVNTIKQYETNKREPQYQYLLKICDFFNVQPDFLQVQRHMYPQDIGKHESAIIISNQKTILSKKNITTIKYSEIIKDIINNNVNSYHILKLIQSLDLFNDYIRKIYVNKKKLYFEYNDSNYNICYNKMYFECNEKNNTKKLRKKPLSEIEAFIYAQNDFDNLMIEMEKELKKVFIVNFKEDYEAYKNNFKRKIKKFENE